MEKIGLVTITYNSADVLKGFLDSTFKQSFQNFIIYIIDNNSQDDTVSIIEKDKDERIVLIKNSENVGVAKANNQGIKLALKDDCSQVLIVNNDIEFEEQLFNKMLKENPEQLKKIAKLITKQTTKRAGAKLLYPAMIANELLFGRTFDEVGGFPLTVSRDVEQIKELADMAKDKFSYFDGGIAGLKR